MCMHDGKPCVMMESIKNVAVSDFVPSFLLLSFPSQCSCDKVPLDASMDSTLQCEVMRSVYGLYHPLKQEHGLLCLQ